MRIQHNILAMNAYRNYNTNTSALSKNLEKLSSGYKINRAGDDAAGLAISEKMRAQITGLNAAQKNVKDGISLVKTAEGAMQEIQDMLNRMDYLATQSANGTYQDEVDRENLNKEMEALKTEINRIADSANFNGIKLLDGSLDTSKLAQDAVTETVTVDPTKENALTFESGKLAEVGQTLGVNTVLHNEALTDGGTSFSVDLHNFEFNAAKGNSMTMKVGDTEITLTATTDHGKVSDAALVGAFLGGNGYEITVDGKTVDTLDGMQINGQTMEVKKDDTLNYRLTFTQKNAPASEADEINGAMNVNISGKIEAKKAEYTFDTSALSAGPAAGDVLTINGKSYVVTADDVATPADAWKNIIGNMEKEGLEGYKITVDGTKVTMKATEAGEKTTPTVAYKAIEAATGAGLNGTHKVTGKDPTQATGTPASTLGSVTANTGTLAIGGETVIEAGDFDGSAAMSGTTSDGKYAWEVTAAGAVTIKGAADAGSSVNGTSVDVSVDGATAVAVSFAGGKDDAAKDTWTYDVTGWNDSSLGALKVTVNSADIELDYDKLSAAGDRGLDVGTSGYKAVLDGDTLTLTAKNVGAVATTNTGANAAPAYAPTTIAFNKYANPVKLTSDDITVVMEGAEGGEMQGITEGAHGDFNVSTTAIQNVAAGGADRLASTYFELTDDMVKDGSELTIGTETYIFTTDKKLAEGDNYVYAGDDLLTTAKNLTDKAKGNDVWTVGHDGTRITLTETVAHAGLDDGADYEDGTGFKFDLSTEKGIEESLGFIGAGSYTKEEVVSEATEGGKALNLQIGDTSDEFNQMKVSIGDMHVNAMGTFGEDGKLTKSISDIDILNPENAAEAVDVIKNAINYVSGVRGDLGAYQNRLEHTANNLSVMAENIQDAESTIRDTDIAEEMMAYTKNNILVQSAQAMLAQANAVPQGVLQLLG